MTQAEKDEILNTYKWIKVPRYEELGDGHYPEEKYEHLEKHHIEETTFLIEKLRQIVRDEIIVEKDLEVK
jgi:hypothetical protein